MLDSSFRTLAQSARYRLGHSYETVLVIEKATSLTHAAGNHYGDPSVGLITPDEEWFVTGGEGVQCHNLRLGTFTFFRSGTLPLQPGAPVRGLARPILPANAPTWFVHHLRLTAPHLVRILLDPWSQYASVWALDLSSMSLSKISDGPYLANTPHTDHVHY